MTDDEQHSDYGEETSNTSLEGGEEFKVKLAELGLQAFFVVSENGLPILERIYSPTDLSLKGEEPHSLSGMMSTIVKFANDISDGLVSDIGLMASRLYFDFFSDLLFVVLFDEKQLLHHKLMNIQTLLKGTVSSIKTVFQVYLGEDTMETTDLYMLREEWEKLGPTIDRMLLDQHEEILQMLQDDSFDNKLPF